MRKMNRLTNRTTRTKDVEAELGVCYFWPKKGYPRPTHIGLKNNKIGFFLCNQKGIFFKSYVNRIFIPIPDDVAIIGVKFFASKDGINYREPHWIYEQDVNNKKIKEL